MSQGLLSYSDLEARWKAQGRTAEARRKWVRRRCVRLGLRPMVGFGRGECARFRPASVERAEARASGEGRAA